MFLGRLKFLSWVWRISLAFLLVAMFAAPGSAHASWEIIDRLDLSPFIPRVLDAFMMVARGVYEYFVGKGDGIIYLLIWTFLGISVFMYAFKMYFPKRWVEFIGLSGGGEMWDGKLSGMNMTEGILKRGMRAVIAAVFLLQIKPAFVTEWLVNPFLEFGAIYTGAITDEAKIQGIAKKQVKCPESVLSGDWLSKRSCEFLVQPVADISAVNNAVIKRGFESVSRGLRGLLTLVPHGGANIMDIITGTLLIFTFVGCNFFMALLIIQGIFDFGIALILYPFSVLTWVAKSSDKWFDVLPAFDGIIKALQQLVITMIACAFILIINVAIVRALFHWDGTVFSVAAGGFASSNLPTTNTVGFGGHSVVWLSALLTFFLMKSIFDLTRKQITTYSKTSTAMYDQAKSDFDANIKRARGIYDSVKKALGLIKK